VSTDKNLGGCYAILANFDPRHKKSDPFKIGLTNGFQTPPSPRKQDFFSSKFSIFDVQTGHLFKNI
jgi:hypothetical protein